MTRARGPQLITYPDSLGGDLGALEQIFASRLVPLFTGGIHLLPPFPSSGDRGFAPITYTEIDPSFGSWADIRRLARHGDLMVDVMVNHISRRSEQFADFVARGRASPWADLFITLDKIWPDGNPPAEDLEHIFLRKPSHPFSDITITATGETERIWTSFGTRVDSTEQIDLDVWSPLARELQASWFDELARNGVTAIRLDAIGYVTKRAGTSCFMVEPDIWKILDMYTEMGADAGLEILPEVHTSRVDQYRLAEHHHRVYDFVLPGVVLHSLLTGDAGTLTEHLGTSPADQITMLDCHDGIPIQPDLDGTLPRVDAERVIDACLGRGANLNRILGAAERSESFDAHQVNITYRDAAGSDDGYVIARALQLFAPGQPQVYYVGLLGGRNDDEAVERTGQGRAINRHDYSIGEFEAALVDPVVARQQRLLELRAHHPAFHGQPTVERTGPGSLTVTWRDGDHLCRLDIDLRLRRATVTGSGLAAGFATV